MGHLRTAASRLWSLQGVATLLIFALIFYALFLPIRSDDVFMYLALGRRLFNGGLPEVDPFLFSIPNYHWHVWHEWGTYVLYYCSYLLGGYSGVITLKVLLISLMASVSSWKMIRSRNFLFVPLVLIALYSGTQRFTEKASLFSELFTLLLMVLLFSRSLSKTRWFILVPGTFLVWINVHPGVPLGVGLFSIAMAGALLSREFNRFKILLGSMILSLACCLLNPEGLAGFLYPFEKIFDPSWQVFRELFFEWRPTFTAGFSTSPEVFSMVTMWACAFASVVTNYRKRPHVSSLCLILFIMIGSNAIRFMLLSSLGCLAIISENIGNRTFGAKAQKIGWTFAGLLPISLFLFIFNEGYPTFNGTFYPGLGFDERAVPEKAADYLEKSDWQGNMFNETDWGSYFAWRWDGKRKVFYHGHIDDPNFLKGTYMKIYESQASFDHLIKEYQIKIFVTQTLKLMVENPRAISYLISHVDKDWRIAYFDTLAVVLVLPPQQKGAE